MTVWCKFKSISSVLFSTVLIKDLRESSSMPRKTHWPSTTYPVVLSFPYLAFVDLLFSRSASFLPASHTSIQNMTQLFLYLPLIQILAPPVNKVHDFLQRHVCILEPASFSILLSHQCRFPLICFLHCQT